MLDLLAGVFLARCESENNNFREDSGIQKEMAPRRKRARQRSLAENVCRELFTQLARCESAGRAVK